MTMMRRKRKAIGILEASILMALLSSAMVAIRGYVEKSIKTTTKNYTDAILVKKADQGQGDSGQKEYYEQNPMVTTETSSTESQLQSNTASTREYVSKTTSTPLLSKRTAQSSFYIDVVPAQRGFVKPVRIWDVNADVYDQQLFKTDTGT